MPQNDSAIPWRAVISTDIDHGGSSTLRARDSSYNIEYDFFLTDNTKYPFTSFALRFVQQEQDSQQYVDLSAYTRAKFYITCNPANILSFTIYSFDEAISREADLSSLRILSTYFACTPQQDAIEIQLGQLETPEWWLALNTNLANRNYSLKKTSSITFGNSTQSPLGTSSHVLISNLVLEGRNWTPILIGIIGVSIIWGIFAWWVIKEYTGALMKHVQERIAKDTPFVAYQQLSIEPHKDKERNALLKFMVTEYPNPDLGMDLAIKQLGINRSKINDILKSEVGLTFNTYLNKLRLTEAARLLSNNANINVAEVAYSVGYNNVSYFNRLFKSEYRCTPKVFRSLTVNKDIVSE
ncbi:helix-turn-helix domain-containing protein [Cellvibrio japonicus]|uniref:helix-turn-helix domain-containing protein n=1 Tax=Cellvibrio japonicus TaxID=155077 RepID=UPI001305463F|nr:helix-turn-helix transcriptional regulator [Cellvibrio japonicus]